MKRRELMATHLEEGLVVAGRCSRCHRPFESASNTSPVVANRELLTAFSNHACSEDVSQAAFRVVKESTEKI